MLSCKRTGKSKGKRKALESDDDDEISEQVPKPANKTAAPKPAAKAMPKPKNAASSSTTEDKAASEKEVVRNAEGKVRKTRRVVRSEMVMNKRGYMGSSLTPLPPFCLYAFLSSAKDSQN